MTSQPSSRRQSMDVSAVVGLVCAVGAVVVAQRLEGGRVQSLIQPTAAVVVFGGTFAALLVSFPLMTLRRTVTSVRQLFVARPPALRATVAELSGMALRAKKKGLMSLENSALEASDRFLGRALAMAIDGVPPEDIRRAMESESHAQEEFDDEAAHVLESAAGYAPTLGILGAVLGLIHVMENLAAPSKLGAGIAVAFVATVYGVGSANLLFTPLAARVRVRTRASALARELVVDAVIAIQQGVHPRQLEEQLEAYVGLRETRPKQRRAA